MSRQKRSSRHSKKRKLVSCFFGLHGSVCTFFKRVEILEKDCRGIKKKKKMWQFLISSMAILYFQQKKKLKQS